MPRIGVQENAPADHSSALGTGSAEKNALLERIIATPPFKGSERLVSFLLHICRMEAAGRASEISEQQIGIEVFGRSKNYDPSVDGIVRSHASRLRLRLDQYFENEGVDEPIRLSMPRGAYVPIYESRIRGPKSLARSLEIMEPSQAPLPLADTVHPASGSRGRLIWAAVGLSIVTAFFAGAALNSPLTSGFMIRAGLRSPSDALWRTVFVPGRVTSLVVGDAGLNMFENMAKRQVSAEEYSNHTWLSEPLAQTPPGYSWVPIPARSYTPWFVVDFAIHLARIPAASEGNFKMIAARDMTLDNLKNDQLVLIGGPEYNPWEQLMGKEQNFHVVFDGAENSISFLNNQPGTGERPVYKWNQTNPPGHTGYALISLSKNLNGTGHILTLQGSTAQGDASAAEFLLDRDQIDPYLKQALTSDGRLNDFEILLQTNFMAGGNFDNQVLAFRVHP